MELAQLGATVKGGVCRLALTDLDRQARDLFVRWCEEAGCTVTVDGVGNIFARRPGRNAALAPVMTGSHIDTQPTGGKFDGCFGVLAGVESCAPSMTWAYRPKRRWRWWCGPTRKARVSPRA